MTRVDTGARARQLARRARRVDAQLTGRVAPPENEDVPTDALRQRLNDARGYLGRLRTLTSRTEELVDRLEKAIAARKTT